MLFYGHNSKTVSANLIDEKCTYCDSNKLSIIVQRPYSHVFWIPMFPMKMVGMSVCGDCKQLLTEKEMPASYKKYVDDVKSYSKAPLWMWSGLIACGLLLSYGIFASQKHDELKNQLISAPKLGQIYEWRNEQNEYTLSKIVKINKDTVYVQWSDYTSTKLTGLTDISKMGDKAFGEQISPFTLNELKSKLEKGDIVDIEN
ncbi:MAG: hypothetical protein IT245_08710 [Bacteroidia bacterium]|nr:hypothetical protein [Bacteroidia bacterium]